MARSKELSQLAGIVSVDSGQITFDAKISATAGSASNDYITLSQLNAAVATKDNSDEITEGVVNLYYTDSRARNAISASGPLNYNSSTGELSFTMPELVTTNITEGTNLYYTDARVRSVLTADNIANKAYVDSSVSNLIAAAPTALDTLNELAAALGDDPNFATTVSTQIGLKFNSADFNSTFDSRLSTKSTTNIVEGANLYYTSARANADFDTRLATKTTSNLTEGTNQYFTTARARSSISATGSLSYNSTTGVISYTTPTTIASLSNHTTSNLAEGTNLYYTDARVGTYLTNNAYATQTYVNTAISNLVDTAPSTLDTLNELAAALGDDPNFATTVSTQIGLKLDSSAYTASDVLTKIKTVDGTGSGLDADLLDGQHGSYYYSSGNPPPYPAEADTLATVTARGATTSTSVTLSSDGNHYSGHLYYDAYDAAGNYYPHFLSGSDGTGGKINWRIGTGSGTYSSHYWDKDQSTFFNSVRAPIFYDSNNTGYYVDPASSGAAIVANGYMKLGNSFYAGDSIDKGYYQDSSNGAYRALGTDGTRGYYFQSYNGANTYLYVGLAGTYANRVGIGTTQPATTLHVAGQSYLSANSTQLTINRPDSGGPNWGFYNWNGGLNIFPATASDIFIGRDGGNTNLQLYNGNLYAPIMYDSNNTAYYGDFASTSRMNVVHANTFLGEITDSGNGDANAPFRFESDYSGWVSLLANTPGAGNGWGTFWAGNDNPAYTYFGSTNPNEYVFVGAGAVKASIDLDNGQSYFGTSVRSPLFYDSDNTGYYADFASTGTSINVAGNIYAAGDIYSSYSDIRLKNVKGRIINALDKVCAMEGFLYEANETAKEFGVSDGIKVGISAQSAQENMPEIVAERSDGYLTVQYERAVPYLIEAIKELKSIIDAQSKEIEELKKR